MKVRKLTKCYYLKTRIINFSISRLVFILFAFYSINLCKAQTFSCTNSPLSTTCLSGHANEEFKCIISSEVSNLSGAIEKGLLLDKISAESTPQFVMISGKFTFDGNYVFASGSEILMDKDAEIIVVAGGRLTIDNTNIFGCEFLWKDILLKEGSVLNIKNHSTIQDASIGVNMSNYSICNASNSSFINNYISVNVAASLETGSPKSIKMNISVCTISLEGSGVKHPPSNNSATAIYAQYINYLNLNAQEKNEIINNTVNQYLNGIVVRLSNIAVSNWQFSNLGIGIICDNCEEPKGDYYASIIGLGETASSPVTFNKVSTGISLQCMKSASVSECRFDQVRAAGVRVNGNPASNIARIKINNNRFERIVLNAILDDYTLTDLFEIKNNYIRKTLWPNGNQKAPMLIDIDAAGSDAIPNINISDNTIEDDNSSISNGTAFGIRIVNVNGGKVENNKINMNDLDVNIQGISATLSNNISFKNNTVTGPGINGNSLQRAMSFDVCTNNYIGCNITDEINTGIRFDNNCDGTEFKDNIINSHINGLYLGTDITVTGQQDNKFNKWPTNTPDNVDRYEALFSTSDDAYKNASAIIVHISSLPSTQWPQPLGTSGWFSHVGGATTSSYDCFTSIDQIPGKNLTIADNYILHNSFPLDFPGDEFDHKLYLFEKLSKTDTLHLSGTSADTFYNENFNGIIGNLYRIERGIDSLYITSTSNSNYIKDLTDDKNEYLLEIDSLFNLINALGTDSRDFPSLYSLIHAKDSIIILINSNLTDIFNEINEDKLDKATDLYNSVTSFTESDEWIIDRLKVDEIILSSIISENIPIWNNEQIADLQNIAEKCRYTDGLAVTLARIMIDTTYDDESLCSIRSSKSIVQNTINIPFLNKAYPNPFTNEFQINLEKNFFVNEMEFTDLLGNNLKFDSKINDSKIIIIPKNLQVGFYFFKLINENGRVILCKLFKSK